MERTSDALEAWREANRQLDCAAQKMMENPSSEYLRQSFREAAGREKAARDAYHAQIERVRVRQPNVAN